MDKHKQYGLDQSNIHSAWIAARDIKLLRQENACAIREDSYRENLSSLKEERCSLEKKIHIISQYLDVALAKIKNIEAETDTNIEELAGVIDKERKISILTFSRKIFSITGKISDEKGNPIEHRDVLITFAFKDKNGADIIGNPKWVSVSKKYGFYRYISPDAGGWFVQSIIVPDGCESLILGVVDFRESLGKKNTSVKLIISHLALHNNQLVYPDNDDNSNQEIELSDIAFFPEKGVSFLYLSRYPQDAGQIKFSLYTPSGGATALNVHATMYCIDGNVRHSKSVKHPSSLHEISQILESDIPFTQAVIHLVPSNKPSVPLAIGLQAQICGVYPRTSLVKRVIKGGASVLDLNRMAEDYENRGKWYGVYQDIHKYAGEVAAVREVTDTLLINARCCFSSGKEQSRNGALVTARCYDASGKDLGSPDGFSPSRVGMYRYIATRGKKQENIVPLNLPAGTRYVAFALYKWTAEQFTFIDSDVSLVNCNELYEFFESTKLANISSDKTTRHGLFAVTGKEKEIALYPNSSLDVLQGAASLCIRFADDEPYSVWRDMGETTLSPDIFFLRKIIAAARDMKMIIILDISEKKSEVDILTDFVLLADVLVIHRNQKTHAQVIALENVIDIISHPII